jgi:hypothetical protein
VLSDPDRCPADPDEVAEAYCLGTLYRAAAALFEDHYGTCNRCVEIVEATERYGSGHEGGGAEATPGTGGRRRHITSVRGPRV